MRSSMCSTHFVTTNDNFSEFVFFVHLLNETIFIQKINMIDEIERWKMVILMSTENSNVFNGNSVYLNSDIQRERERKVQKIPLTWYVQRSYRINAHTFAVHFLNAKITFPIRMCCYLTATNSKWFCILNIVLCGTIRASAKLSEEKKIAIIILNNSRKNSVRQSTW